MRRTANANIRSPSQDFQGLQEKVKPIEFKPSDDPLIQQELENIAEYNRRCEETGEKL